MTITATEQAIPQPNADGHAMQDYLEFLNRYVTETRKIKGLCFHPNPVSYLDGPDKEKWKDSPGAPDWDCYDVLSKFQKDKDCHFYAAFFTSPMDNATSGQQQYRYHAWAGIIAKHEDRKNRILIYDIDPNNPYIKEGEKGIWHTERKVKALNQRQRDWIVKMKMENADVYVRPTEGLGGQAMCIPWTFEFLRSFAGLSLNNKAGGGQGQKTEIDKLTDEDIRFRFLDHEWILLEKK
ncbi:uncharacterized protein EI97DRAFT_440499 [Westerdykella ornata]|uniref:Uncharacterized protein n=1 Tax=Westerdykella ornata TaxID=318751 RepID=A0A6A6JRW8_WESOR|nr:uncharacterized protein EI97DRAFT_440499 [Westerdykella ornata]KAF2279014.1 hypothetical protein EI97DRAFT_440499 [Westerdykella ornata]